MPGTFDQSSPKSFSLGELAERSGATLKGDAGLRIAGVGAIEQAQPDQLSFVVEARYAPLIARCRAGALIVPPALSDIDRSLLIHERPYLALARIAQLFEEPPFLEPGVHLRAYVDTTSRLGPDVAVGPLAQVGAGCTIGRGSRIYGGAYLGRDVTVGEDCLIYPNVTILDRCRVGNRVIIHSGTVVGSDGFGFAQDEQNRHVKIPQKGIVQIDDDVEIGSNCSIDRATFGRTWIQYGTKIDNLVQIAHNVVVGEHSILIAQVGISGSTRLGRHVIVAGQAGLLGHIQIGDGARVAAKSGVTRSLKAGEEVSGIPAAPHREWMKTVAVVRRLPQLREELKQLKMQVQRLEERLREESV